MGEGARPKKQRRRKKEKEEEAKWALGSPAHAGAVSEEAEPELEGVAPTRRKPLKHFWPCLLDGRGQPTQYTSIHSIHTAPLFQAPRNNKV